MDTLSDAAGDRWLTRVLAGDSTGPALLLIEGAAGTGKSRLAARLLETAAGVTTASGSPARSVIVSFSSFGTKLTQRPSRAAGTSTSGTSASDTSASDTETGLARPRETGPLPSQATGLARPRESGPADVPRGPSCRSCWPRCTTAGTACCWSPRTSTAPAGPPSTCCAGCWSDRPTDSPWP